MTDITIGFRGAVGVRNAPSVLYSTGVTCVILKIPDALMHLHLSQYPSPFHCDPDWPDEVLPSSTGPHNVLPSTTSQSAAAMPI